MLECSRNAVMTVARYCAAEAIAETNGTSGWCRAAPTPYTLQIRDTETGPFYPNWAKVWQVNAPLLATRYRTRKS